MFQEIQGVSIHYRFIGSDGSPVLLLHGWGCDLSLMEPVAEKLSISHRVLMIDFPGHGKSGRPPCPWGVPEFADCISRLIAHLDFIPCAVIGHSFGCRVATWLAAEQPQLFTRMILTGAAGIRPAASSEQTRRQQQYRRLKSIALKLEKTPFTRRFGQAMQERLIHRFGSKDYQALDPEMRQTFNRIVSQDLLPYYQKIRQSVLLIWGDQDTETPLWMARQMAREIEDSGLVLLEGGSHFAYLEQLDRFCLIAEHFLTEA